MYFPVDALLMKKPRILVFAAIILAGLFPMMALAHAAGGDAYVVEGGKILIEGWMGGNEIPEHATVKVLSPDGSLVFEGKMNEGRAEFSPEKALRYKIIIDMGNGHGKTFDLHPDELKKLESALAGKNEQGKSVPKPEGVSKAEPPRQVSPPPPRRSPGGSGFDLAIKAIIGLLVITQIVTLSRLRDLTKEVRELKESAKTDGR